MMNTPRHSSYFFYPPPQRIDQQPTAVSIPGRNKDYLTPTIHAFRKERRTTDYHRNSSASRKSTTRYEKQGTFASDVTVISLQDQIYSILDNDDRQETICCRKTRLFWLIRAALVVFALGILPTGLWIGLGSRQDEKQEESTDARKNPINVSTKNATDILVGAYYYPWHGNNFHNGDGYVRSQLEPPQYPTLGEYDDSKHETISQHLKWSRQANTGLWVTSWWGPNRLEDNTTKNVIMEHEELGDLKISLHYETTSRVRNGNMEKVESDIHYMCDNYFDHDSYYKIDGRPVIFVYISRVLDLEGFLEQTILMMRSTANRCGKSIFIVGDRFSAILPKWKMASRTWHFSTLTL